MSGVSDPHACSATRSTDAGAFCASESPWEVFLIHSSIDSHNVVGVM
jgi:hypothetical protein